MKIMHFHSLGVPNLDKLAKGTPIVSVGQQKIN